MTVQDHQRVSYEVQKLHSKTLDPKLMRGGTVDAIGFARDAYKKASTLPETWSQWRQLTAYRLAHLLLRQDGSLQEIDELLSIAEGADFLEPLRSFCHLLVLHRMRDGINDPGERDVLNVRCEKAFDTAISHVKGQVNKNTRTANTAEGAENSYTAQDSSFNTLELLSYALKLPYAPLEGISRDTDFSPYRDRRSASHAWQLLSHDFESVWMTEDFARREFASQFTSRISDRPCVAVEITRDGSKWTIGSSDNAVWQSMPEHSDRLLTALLSNPQRSTKDLCKKVVGDRDNAVHFRKVVQRANEAIQTLTDDGDLKLHNERGRAAPYVLTDKIDFLVLRTS
jgi:hypothetical protein